MSTGSRIRAALALVVVLAVVVLAALAWRGSRVPALDAAAAAAAPADAATVARGALLAQQGHCAGCHTVPGGAAYAGGRAIATPFGAVVAGNLTPEAETGLGAWTAADFRRAMRHGVSRDGRLLWPAFPYTEFTQLRDDDVDALYAWLKTLPPVRAPHPGHALRFPYSSPLALAVWRGLFFREQRFEPDTTRSAAWNRGAYLVRGVGHCASCHAPRNPLGATVDALALAGGHLPAEPGWAPPLGGNRLTAQERIELLQAGISERRVIGGVMAEVVLRSTQHWPREDLAAVAEYLGSLPAPAPSEAPAPLAPPEQRELGARLYGEHCADCHGPQGEGVARTVPALAGNPAVRDAVPDNAILRVLRGGFAPATAANPRPHGMPPMAWRDEEVAAVLTHVRQAWGVPAPAVTPREVQRLR